MSNYIILIITIAFLILGTLSVFLYKYLKKKPLKSTLITIIILHILTLYLGILTINISRTNSLKKPLFVISTKIKEYPHYQQHLYKGLGYNLQIKDNGSIIEATLSMFNKVIAGSINIYNSYTIINKTKACDTALEYIASDKKYNYYLPCIQSETILIKHDNGYEETLKEALAQHHLSIESLLKHNLGIIKQAKDDNMF